VDAGTLGGTQMDVLEHARFLTPLPVGVGPAVPAELGYTEPTSTGWLSVETR